MDVRTHYYLECVNGSANDKNIIPLKGDEVVIGRKELLRPHISRCHATFKWHGDRWSVTYTGQNGMSVDGNSLVRNKEYPLDQESEIQFSHHDTIRYKLRGTGKEDGDSVRISRECNKKFRQEKERSNSRRIDGDKSLEHIEVEQQLKGSHALQVQLKEERERMQHSLKEQQAQLEKKYQQEKTQLEEQFQSGVLAQQAMLEEKEVLAERLKAEVSDLQKELEVERKALEERLRQEEERNRVLQEKENELKSLAEEKANLEAEQEQERIKLQQQLMDTQTHKEELRQQVEAKNWAIQAKEAEHQQAEEEKQKLQDQLALERISREEEMSRLQEQLLLTKAEDERALKEALDTLEAEKQKLASTLINSTEAKEEVVNSVSGVLEDEFQCAICNELFINAVLLNCSHTFCRHCIDQWKKNKKDCPSCRIPISSESRSLVVDNFIEKIVPTLSEEMKKKRAEIVAERNAEMKAAAAAAQEKKRASAAGQRGRGRGGRGRGNRGRENQRVQAVLVRPTNVTSTTLSAPSSSVNSPVYYASPLNGQGIIRIRLPPPGSAGNPIIVNYRSNAPPRPPAPGRRGHWANGCPESW